MNTQTGFFYYWYLCLRFFLLFFFLFLLILLFLSCLRCPFLWQNVYYIFYLFFWFLFSFELLLLFPFENKASPFAWSLLCELSSNSLVFIVEITLTVVIFCLPYLRTILTSYASKSELSRINDSFSSPMLSLNSLKSEDSFLNSLRFYVKDLLSCILKVKNISLTYAWLSKSLDL